MISAAPLVAVKFVGQNLVDGKDATCKFFKVRLGAPQGVDMIGEDFGTLSITGTMEADTDNITTAGKSQYFQVMLED